MGGGKKRGRRGGDEELGRKVEEQLRLQREKEKRRKQLEKEREEEVSEGPLVVHFLATIPLILLMLLQERRDSAAEGTGKAVVPLKGYVYDEQRQRYFRAGCHQQRKSDEKSSGVSPASPFLEIVSLTAR